MRIQPADHLREKKLERYCFVLLDIRRKTCTQASPVDMLPADCPDQALESMSDPCPLDPAHAHTATDYELIWW
jgi:hypothetical protein